MLMFGLWLGTQPQVCITSTPRATKLIKYLAADPKTIVSKCTTYDNRAHLAPQFFSEIITQYEGTRLGEQELMAELLEIAEGAWFLKFAIARQVSTATAYDPARPIRIAIDAGSSRHTGPVLFQKKDRPNLWPKITVFSDYHALDVVSADNAAAILELCVKLAGRGPHIVRLDPAAVAKSSLGPAAFNEYARVFGDRITDR